MVIHKLMKSALLFLLCLASGSLFAESQITLSQINQNATFKAGVQTYLTGVDATGATDCSTAFQAAIVATAAVSPAGGRINLTSGTFKISSTLLMDLQVTFWGAGVESTVLKAGGAATIATQILPSPVIDGFNSMFNYLTLDGNSTAAYGVIVQETGNQNFTEVHWKNFTTAGFYIHGGAIITLTKCNWTSNATGVLGVHSGSFPTNHIIFVACRFTSNNLWAVDIDGGANWVFYGCDFEVCGTNGNDNTGVIRCANMCAAGEGRAVTLDGCWMERNSGFAALHIKSPAQPNTQYSWTNSLERFSLPAIKYGIYVDTSASTTSYVLTSGLTLGDHALNDVKLVDARAFWNRGPTVCLGTNNTAAGTVSTWGLP